MGALRALALALGVPLALWSSPALAADPVLVAGGDVACSPGSAAYMGGNGTLEPAPGSCHHKYTSDVIAQLSPLHLLALGDLQYEDGALSRFNASYAPSWGRAGLKEITKPVPGNHEYGQGGSDNDPDTINADPDATGYFTYFADQLAAEGEDAGDPRKGWYSYDVVVGGADAPRFHWHIVALNSECAAGLRSRPGFDWEGGCAAGSAQEQWLRQDLAADDSSCTLAYWHHPRFSSGDNGDNPIMAPIWDALYQDEADVALAGHDHHYERFAQQTPAGEAAPGRGIREFVVGTGGKNFHGAGPTPGPHSETFQNTVYGVLKLTLHGPSTAHPLGWYEWEFVDDGKSGTDYTDSGSADCVGATGSPTPTPTPTSAPAGGGGVAPAPLIAPNPSAPPSLVDLVAPRLSTLGMSRRRFRPGRRSTRLSGRSSLARSGTVVRYRLSEPATASLRIQRRGRRRGKVVYRTVATLTRRGKAGAQRVAFTGRVRGRALRAGRYRISIAARDRAGNRATARALSFVIVP